MPAIKYGYHPSSKKPDFTQMEMITEIHNQTQCRDQQIVRNPDPTDVRLDHSSCIYWSSMALASMAPTSREHCVKRSGKIIRSRIKGSVL